MAVYFVSAVTDGKPKLYPLPGQTDAEGHRTDIAIPLVTNGNEQEMFKDYPVGTVFAADKANTLRIGNKLNNYYCDHLWPVLRYGGSYMSPSHLLPLNIESNYGYRRYFEGDPLQLVKESDHKYILTCGRYFLHAIQEHSSGKFIILPVTADTSGIRTSCDTAEECLELLIAGLPKR